MPEIPDVIPDETIEVEWGNAIRDRTIQRYADKSERTADHPSPSAGDLSYLEDTGAVHVYHSGTWQPLLPVGAVVDFAGSSAPTGWLFTHGQAVSRTTYAELFTAIGTTFGNGDGSTTFNLPDTRRRLVLGKASSGAASDLNDKGGDFNHTHSGPSHSHSNPSVNSNGSHTHTQGNTGAGGSHSHGDTSSSNVAGQGGRNFQGGASGHDHVVGSVGNHSHSNPNTNSGGNHSHSQGSTGASGTGQTGGGNPPYIVLNKIIKAL